MFTPNEGKTDRIVRIILGAVLLALAFLVFAGTLRVIAGIIGVVAVVTGVTGFCGLYKILGISTAGKK